MKIGVAGGVVDALIMGEGRPLIVFHSLLSDRGSWDRISGELAQRFKLVIPALPGFGESTPVEDGLAGFADRMAALVRHVSEPGGPKPIVIGNGFGSFVALQMVIRHPDLLDRLIVAAAGVRFSEPGRAAIRNMANAARTKGLEAISDTAMRRLFAPEFQAANPDLIAERRAAFLAMDPAVLQSATSALVPMDMTEAAPHITIPVLVMCGDGDEATPPPMARELAALLPNAQLIELAGCAHVPQLQKPQEFLSLMMPFLAA